MELCERCRTQRGIDTATLPAPPAPPVVACALCEGLLQDAALEAAGAAVVAVAKDCDAANFSVALCLPPSIALRERLFSVWRRTLQPEQAEQIRPVFALKDILRQQLLARLSAAGVVTSPKSLNLLHVAIQHPHTREILQPLKSLVPKVISGKRVNPDAKRLLPEADQGLFTANNVAQALDKLPDDRLAGAFALPPAAPAELPPPAIVVLQRPSVFVGGRYRKLMRNVPQTAWIIDGERRGISSVHEIIAKELETIVGTDDSKFLAAGREDADVRTLGAGRPFGVELVRPKWVGALTPERLQQFQAELNGRQTFISVDRLQLVKDEIITKLKEGAESKTKTYRCLVWLSAPPTPAQIAAINSTNYLVVHQATPIRVLHRRTAATRDRAVFNMRLKHHEDAFYLLDLETESGTYIKEFVHGDFGRTRPSLGSLLSCQADILSLDVLDVNLDWPPAAPLVAAPGAAAAKT